MHQQFMVILLIFGLKEHMHVSLCVCGYDCDVHMGVVYYMWACTCGVQVYMCAHISIHGHWVGVGEGYHSLSGSSWIQTCVILSLNRVWLPGDDLKLLNTLPYFSFRAQQTGSCLPVASQLLLQQLMEKNLMLSILTMNQAQERREKKRSNHSSLS